jgi:lipopolysaccharide export system protein LptA
VTRLRIGLLCALVPIIALSAQDVTVNFQDRARNMTLKRFEGFVITTQGDGSLAFSGTGTPAVGEWRSQGLTIEARVWKGRATKGDGKAYLLETADVQGAVVVQAAADGKPVVLRTSRASFDGPARRVACPGAVTIEQTTANGTITAQGASGYADLFETQPASAPSLLRKAGLGGPVHLEMRTRKVVDKVERVQTLTADAAQFEYDAVARTVTLGGGVILRGDDDVMAGDARGARAVITLDASGKPIGVEMTGDPGVSHLTRSGGGAQ